MKTVAIIEGWAGGPRLDRPFRKQLSVNGFKVVKSIREADFVFAHSTGCYMIPSDSRANQLFLLDPPYWPGRSIVGRWADLMKTDWSLLKSGAGAGGFISKKLWETYYIFAKPTFTWSVIKNQSHLDFLERHQDKQIVLVRNQHDQFCSSKIKDHLKNYKNVKYVELQGNHEDYYINPQPYIDLLLKELK